MANPAMTRTIQVVDFVGELEHRFPQSFIVKYSDKADSSSPLQDTEGKLKKNIEGERHLKLTNKCILKDGSDLKIEIHKTHSWQSKIPSLWRTPKSDSPCKTRINFDDLWKHLISEAQKATKLNFKVEFDNPIEGLHLWIIAEAHDCNLSALSAQVKATMENLNSFRPTLNRLGSVRDVFDIVMELGKPLSGLNITASKVFDCIEVVYKHFEAQDESHEAMKNLANSMGNLACQLNRLKKVPKSDELGATIGEFPGMMEEVVDFIQEWLKNWIHKYILVAAQKDKAIELRGKLDAFMENFNRDLLIEIRVEQANNVANLQENAKAAAEQKELDDLVCAS